MKSLKLIGMLAAKDLRIEFRSRLALLNTLFFALLILVIFQFAFDPGDAAARRASPGILWVALLFPGVLQLNRGFQSETEEGTIFAVILSPVERGNIFLGKFLANWVFLLAIDLLILGIFLLAYSFPLGAELGWIVLLILLVGAGFSAVGTVFAAMCSNLRSREVLLPILLFPLLIPVILAAVNATQEILFHAAEGFFVIWLQVIISFDVIYLAAGYLLFDYVLAD